MKIKVKKFVPNLQADYVIHIRNLKQALNHRLVLKKVHRVIKFNQNDWLKPYIEMNTGLTKKAKNDFEKYFYKLMKNAVWQKLWKILENTEILNLSQQKEEETIWCLNQIIISQSFSQNFC